MTPERARALWIALEPLHDVTYFTPQARAAHEEIGLRGFWRGYVAMRAAPLGAAGLGLVTAAFFNFAPRFLARSVPSVWELASPGAALRARESGAVAALEAYLPGARDGLADVLPVLRRVLTDVPWTGALGAANAALETPEDPLSALWHAATVLREHRGDGHIAVLTAEGIGGLEAHVLRDAEDGSRAMLMASRGWTEDEWAGAAEELAARGLLGDGLTEAGAKLRAHVERRTDELAAFPYRGVTDDEFALLDSVLTPLARALVPAAVPAANPVGAPAP
ncbi:SCO6745 family protein [Amycolatopsis sp. CA-230715]|uniref:SCO6745 family protein n=1 Tax=Amycolatopsis sp. CA-230715 TaxID=2745196 RepID=UPI001C01DDD1|nr:hypothetical protein [Amycolatopsis sp. CA-230715]QWF76962.1 hypothetical protein HUW46_00342 [Amycolatopsis sp. CA-230715]